MTFAAVGILGEGYQFPFPALIYTAGSTCAILHRSNFSLMIPSSRGTFWIPA